MCVADTLLSSFFSACLSVSYKASFSQTVQKKEFRKNMLIIPFCSNLLFHKIRPCPAFSVRLEAFRCLLILGSHRRQNTWCFRLPLNIKSRAIIYFSKRCRVSLTVVVETSNYFVTSEPCHVTCSPPYRYVAGFRVR